MKQHFSYRVFSIILLLFPFISQAQQPGADCDSNQACCQQLKTRNSTAVKKGYYAIGNNAQKLETERNCYAYTSRSNGSTKSIPAKGYYAIANNRHKLVRQNEPGGSTIAPVAVTKGYYAIGNNASNLATGNSAMACCCCCK